MSVADFVDADAADSRLLVDPYALRPTVPWLVEHAPELQALPAVAHQALFAVQAPEPDLPGIARLIQTDQALAAEILRAANSAFAQRGYRIARVNEAVVRIGTEWLQQLLFTLMARGLLEAGLAPYGLSRSAVWRHAAATAQAASLLAATTEAAAPDVAAVAGLLHDVGKTLLARKLADDCRAVTSAAQQEWLPIYLAERAHFGFDHAAVGGAYLTHLGLPDAVCDAVTHHHEPHLGAVLADVIHLADLLAHQVLDGDSASGLVAELHARDRLQLSTTTLLRLEADLRRGVKDGLDLTRPMARPAPAASARAPAAPLPTTALRRRQAQQTTPSGTRLPAVNLDELRTRARSEAAAQEPPAPTPAAVEEPAPVLRPWWRRLLAAARQWWG